MWAACENANISVRQPGDYPDFILRYVRMWSPLYNVMPPHARQAPPPLNEINQSINQWVSPNVRTRIAQTVTCCALHVCKHNFTHCPDLILPKLSRVYMWERLMFFLIRDKKKLLKCSTTHFWICPSLKAHSLASISSIMCLLLSSCFRSFSGGRLASQARLARARAIISTSARPAGRPRPVGIGHQRQLTCKLIVTCRGEERYK